MPLGLAIFLILLAVMIKRAILLCQFIVQTLSQREDTMVPDTFAWRAGTPVKSKVIWLEPDDFNELQGFWVRSHYRSLSSKLDHAIATGDLMPKYQKKRAVRARLAKLLKQDPGNDEEGQSSAEYLERLLGSSQLFQANGTATNRKNGVAENEIDRTRVDAGRIKTPRLAKEKLTASGNDEDGQSSAEYLDQPLGPEQPLRAELKEEKGRPGKKVGRAKVDAGEPRSRG